MTTGVDTRQKKTVAPFGVRDKIGYLFGDFGSDFVFIFASSYLLLFYTNVAALNPAHVGLMFLLVRLVDAFTDLIWGRFLDSHRASKAGRFRVWIVRAALPLVVMSALLYLPAIGDWEYAARMAYAAVTYLLFGTVFYTMVNISYGSMASVLTADPVERTSLSVWRSVGAALAGVFVGVVPPLFIYGTIDGQSQLLPMNLFFGGVIFAAAALVCLVLCYSLTTERVVAARPEVRRSAGTVLRTLVRNRALLALLVGNLIMILAIFLQQSMNPYLWLNYFNDGRLSAIASFVTIAPMLLLAPAVARLGQRFGKKEVAVAATAIGGLGYVVIFLLKITDPIVFLLLSVIGAVGIAAFNLLVWAFITDVIDDVEVRSGSRDDGTVYSVNTWMRKLGQAAVGGLAGVVLALIGFQAGQPTQSAQTVDGIYLVATLVPGLLLLGFAVFAGLVYPLNRARVQANVAELRARRAAAEA